MQDIAEFLRTHDPFSGLDEEALERLVEVEVEVFEAGATIFKQGERSQGRVLVVRRGAIELVDGSRVLDVLGEGELFGHPSMLSGRPFGFEARAQEDSRCYSMAASDVIPLLARRSQAFTHLALINAVMHLIREHERLSDDGARSGVLR
jgi:CBS domain-containing protein